MSSPVDYAGSLAQAERLKVILDDEFDALRAQDMARFEALQPSKAEILSALALLAKRVLETPGATDDPHWLAVQTLVNECREAHRRNDILIRSKLESIRATLRMLQNADSDTAVDVYDRLGRLSGPGRGRRRGYDA